MLELLKQNDVALLSESVKEVLEKVGFMVENREILKALEEFGADVDYDNFVAKFPSGLVDAFAEKLRNEDKGNWKVEGENRKVIYSGFRPYDMDNTFKNTYQPHLFHPLSTFYYDDEKKEMQKGSRENYIKLIKIAEGLNPEAGAGHLLLLSEVASEVEPIEAVMVQLENAVRPRGAYIHDVKQIDYIKEIMEIFGIEDPYFPWMANICCNSPLKMDKTVAERVVYMVRSGLYPMKACGMPVSGVNMPVSLSGTVVVFVAEVMAQWMIGRSLREDVPLTAMPISGTLDMRTGNVSFTAIDALRMRLCFCELLRKWTGVLCSPGPGEYNPTKEPGLYNALEKAYTSMVFTAFTGYHPEVGFGHVDAGLATSPAQLIIDTEFTKSLSFLESPEISKENIGMDAILKVGFGLAGNFMEEDHTLMNFRTQTWDPVFFTRNGWSSGEERKIMDKAIARSRELIESHRAPEVDGAKLEKAKNVLEKAKKDLVGKLDH